MKMHQITKPLRIAVNTCHAVDKGRIAERYVKELMAHKPNKFNNLEVMNIEDREKTSYSGLRPEDIRRCLWGYFYETKLVAEKLDMFNGTSDIIMCGGKAGPDRKQGQRTIVNEFKWAVVTVLAIKLQSSNSKAKEFLQRNFASFVRGEEAGIAALSIETPNPLNIHFYTKAIHADTKLLRLTPGKISWKFDSAEHATRVIEENRDEFDRLMFNELPFMDYEFFKDIGIPILSFKDGDSKGAIMSRGEGMPVNFYYWSEMDLMNKFFEKKVFPYIPE